MKRPKSDYEIQTVRNAFRLLEAFREREELGVTELSRLLDLHKNNVFRLLATLEQAGYVEQSTGSDRYCLAVGCVELGHAYLRNRGLLRLARPLLERLAEGCGESAHLGALRGLEVVHLAGEKAPRLVQSELRIGIQLPAHCTALGKVLLACAGERVRERFDREVLAVGLEARTPTTIVDPDKFREHLHTVASQGFALDLEECEPGLCCAATPVFDASGRLVAALSISAPAFRVLGDRLERTAVPALVAAADELSHALGAPR